MHGAQCQQKQETEKFSTLQDRHVICESPCHPLIQPARCNPYLAIGNCWLKRQLAGVQGFGTSPTNLSEVEQTQNPTPVVVKNVIQGMTCMFIMVHGCRARATQLEHL